MFWLFPGFGRRSGGWNFNKRKSGGTKRKLPANTAPRASKQRRTTLCVRNTVPMKVVLVEEETDDMKPYLRTEFAVQDLTVKLNNSKYKTPRLLLNKDKQIYFFMEFETQSDKSLKAELQFTDNVEFEKIIVYVNFKKNDAPVEFQMISSSDPKIYKSTMSKDVSGQGHCQYCESEFSHCCKSEKTTLWKYKINDFVIFYKLRDDETNTWTTAARKMFWSHDYTDLTIVARNVEFKAHKMVVASKSEILKSMIDSDIKNKKENKIYLDKVEPSIVEEILQYMYLGSCDLKKGVGIIYEAANEYKICGLLKCCREHLSSNLNMENIIEALNLVDLYKLAGLKVIVKKFVKKNEAELSKNPDFAKYLLNSMDAKNIHEIFKTVMSNNMDIVDKVKSFIKDNKEEVECNESFKKLIQTNPTWTIEE